MQLHKLIAKHAKLLLEQPLIYSIKTKLTESIKNISKSVTDIEKVLVVSCETQEEEDEELAGIEFYKNALEKMKQQTVLLRE